MKTMKHFVIPAVVCLMLAGCGTSKSERALSGGAIGAGVGALGGSLVGGSGTTGALIGAGVGAATGAITDPDTIQLDKKRK